MRCERNSMGEDFMERVAWRRRGMTRAVRPRVTANCDGSATFFDSTRVGDDIGGQDQKMGKQYEEEGKVEGRGERMGRTAAPET